ncbi:MAG: acyltransferase family protein, partial [Bacillota bacterium]|nr:acyltransferase family protein [Bacillota bacterium]
MKKSKKKSVKNNNKLKYIHSLDSMRVLAMLGVMMFHLFPTKVSGGFLGVVTFFVLAGFLTMRDIVQNGNRDPLSAFGKKLRKLMPELIAMVFITVAVMSVFLSEYLPDVKNQAVSSIFGVNNLVQIADGESYFEAMASLKPFTHIWAHSMELQFYLLLLLSAGFFYKDRHKHAWIVGLSVLAVISVILMHVFYIDPDQVTRIYYGTDTRIFSFLIGMIGAIAFGEKENRIVGNGPVHSLTACVLMVLSGVLFFTVKNGASVYRFTFLFYSLLQLLLIYFLSVRKTFAYRVFGNNIFKCIAARSYSLYLWHFPVMKLYEKLMWSRNIGVFRYILFELLLILLVTEFFYRLFRWIHAKNHKRFNVPVYSAVGCMIIALCLYPYKPIGAEANQKHLLLLSLKKSISDVDVNIGTKGNVVPVTTEKQTQTQTETETEKRTTSQSPSAESVIQESGDDRTVGATEASAETSVETSSGVATEVTTPTTPDSSGQTSAESTTEGTTADSLPVTTEAETQVESGTGDTKAVTAP